MGKPPTDEQYKYMVMQIDNISIYYPSKLKLKRDFTAIHITLKKLLFYKWLEIEGAMGIVSVV